MAGGGVIENLRKQARRAGGPARARPVCCGGLPRSAAACSCARSAAITNGAAVSQSVRPSPSPPGVGGKVRRVAGHDPDRRRRRRRRPTRRLQAQHARQTRPPRGGHRRRLPSESGAWQRVGGAVGCICRQAAAGTPALRARIAPLRRCLRRRRSTRRRGSHRLSAAEDPWAPPMGRQPPTGRTVGRMRIRPGPAAPARSCQAGL